MSVSGVKTRKTWLCLLENWNVSRDVRGLIYKTLNDLDRFNVRLAHGLNLNDVEKWYYAQLSGELNHQNLLEWCLKSGWNYGSYALGGAVERGHFELAKWITSAFDGYLHPYPSMHAAVRSGNALIVDWVHQRFHADKVIDYHSLSLDAVEIGSVEILEWISGKSTLQYWTFCDMWRLGCRFGSIDVLKWISKSKELLAEHVIEDGLAIAALNGHKRTIDWCETQGLSITAKHHNVVNKIIKAGLKDFCRLGTAYQHYGVEILLSEIASFEWKEATFEVGLQIFFDDLKNVRWLLDNGCCLKKELTSCVNAINWDKPELVNLLIEYGFPWDSSWCSIGMIQPYSKTAKWIATHGCFCRQEH